LAVVGGDHADGLAGHRGGEQRGAWLVPFDGLMAVAVAVHRGHGRGAEAGQLGWVGPAQEPGREGVDVTQVGDRVDVHAVEAGVDPGLGGQPWVRRGQVLRRVGQQVAVAGFAVPGGTERAAGRCRQPGPFGEPESGCALAGRAEHGQQALVGRAGEAVGQLPADRPPPAGFVQAGRAEAGPGDRFPAQGVEPVEHGCVEGPGREAGLCFDAPQQAGGQFPGQGVVAPDPKPVAEAEHPRQPQQ
jgi:hypothetical protein